MLWLLGEALPADDKDWHRLPRYVRSKIRDVRDNDSPEMPLDVLLDLHELIMMQLKVLERSQQMEYIKLEEHAKQITEIIGVWRANVGGVDYAADFKHASSIIVEYPEYLER